MKRREILAAGALSGMIPLTGFASKQAQHQNQDTSKELYEWRTYDLKFRGNQNRLKSYLNDHLRPAFTKRGANHFLQFSSYGLEEPPKHWVLISYPDAETYLNCQTITHDPAFIQRSADYHSLPPEQAVYTRMKSSLLYAFDGLPKMDGEVADAGLFELRIYEGYSEDAVRRKIMMFNLEEIALFQKIGLRPLFFGEMIAGPYRPCLVYMLYFKDMEERNALWKQFGQHPEWQAMRVKPEYADTVSNIRKSFLLPG